MPTRIIHQKIQELAGKRIAVVLLDDIVKSVQMPQNDVEKYLHMLADLNFITMKGEKIMLTETGALADPIEITY